MAYAEAKERARDQAIDWQTYVEEHCLSYGEFAYWNDRFEKLGKRYGLLKEFRENGIC